MDEYILPDKFFKVKPWDHQRLAASRAALSPDGYGFFFEVGAGKTKTLIDTLRYKYMKSGGIVRTLIFGPVIVLENWKREIIFHSKITEDSIRILSGSQKQRLKILEEVYDRDDVILITNYEVLSRMKELSEKLLSWSPVICGWDESHRCKNIQAKQTKVAIKFADTAQYNYLLSGTPILNSLIDVFSQMRILDKGRTFGDSFFAFRGRYFYDKNSGMSRDKYFPDWRPRQGADEEVKRLIKAKFMHVEKSQCLDLPPLVKKTIPIKLSGEQAKAYESMLKNFIAFVVENDQNKAAVAELALTKALRLQQITTGFVGIEDLDSKKSIHRFKKNPRKEALHELLSELTPHHKVIVWAVWKENYEDIRSVCEKLKVEYVEVHGSIKQADKVSAVDTFNGDPSCRVLIGHPGSGGIGINLVASDVSVFYSRTFSLEYDIQAEARNYRGGSERHDKVTRIDLVAPGTIDEQVVEALASKKQIGYKVLKDFVLPSAGGVCADK